MVSTTHRKPQMAESPAEASPSPASHASQGAPPKRRMRRYIPPVFRHAIIIIWGVLLGVAVSYMLRKLGY